jgi:hypothetical protein
MKPESNAWQRLEEHAAAQLRSGFADGILRASRGPTAQAWGQLQEHGAAQLRRGFAERVLRAVGVEMPSFVSQVALSAATAGFCVLVVIGVHSVNVRRETARNLADWRQLAAQVQDLE